MSSNGIASVLRRLDHLYLGPTLRDGPAELPAPLSLRSLGSQLGVQVNAVPGEVVIAVVGDAGAGKSTFVNAFAQELVLPPSRCSSGPARAPFPVQWVCADTEDPNTIPRLLWEAAKRFPEWRASDFASSQPESAATPAAASTCWSARSGSPRMQGLQLLEVAAPSEVLAEDAEPLAWILANADIIVCLLDSQVQPPVSDSMLQRMKGILGNGQSTKEQPPQVQFLLSKIDLVSRESDRIRLVAKASTHIADRIGRGFEILPVAAGDVSVMLDGLGSDLAEQEDDQRRHSGSSHSRLTAGLLRVLASAKECSARRAVTTLEALKADAETLISALNSKVADEQRAEAVKASSSRAKLLQLGAAMAITACVVPFLLDEDLDQWVVHASMGFTAFLACVLLVAAFFLDTTHHAGASRSSACIAQSKERSEQARFLRLVARQQRAWAVEATAVQEALL